MKITVLTTERAGSSEIRREVILVYKGAAIESHYIQSKVGYFFVERESNGESEKLYLGFGNKAQQRTQPSDNLAAMQICTESAVPDKAIDLLHKACKKHTWHNFRITLEDAALVRPLVQQLLKYNYRFTDFKSQKSFALEEVVLVVTPEQEEFAKQELGNALIISQALNYTRQLAALPANVCDINYMVKEAQALARDFPNCSVKVLGEDKLRALNMNCHLAVGNASSQESRVVCIEHLRGKEGGQTIVLTGKGIVYDTGGLSLKPTRHMLGMHYDMGGAASVLAIMNAIMTLEMPINVVGIVALAENSIGSLSYRPGDIIKSMSGISVEIGDTDAEGRLVLCDTITYAQEYYRPNLLINLATLTGSTLYGLGDLITPIFSTDLQLTNTLMKLARETGDKFWPMPFFAGYDAYLDSDVADVCNITLKSHYAGSITAALFLKRFVKNPACSFVHLDIARFSPEGERDLGRNSIGITTLIYYLATVAG